MYNITEFIKLEWNLMLFNLGKIFFDIKIMSIEETLNKVIKEKKSIARIGDGEFNLAFSQDIGFQKKDENLVNKIKYVLKDTDCNDSCIVCIPGSYSSLKSLTFSSKRFWSYYWNCNKKRVFKLLNKRYIYGDAQCTRIFVNRKNKDQSLHYFKKWKEIWEAQDVLLVEGEHSRFGAGNDLFSNVNSIQRIICPAENAFSVYEEIKNSVLQYCTNKLVILVLGPTATVLAYELSKQGVWVIDSGNLDMEYEWSKINAKSQTSIKGKYTLEAKDGTKIENINDDNYNNQIVLNISKNI